MSRVTGELGGQPIELRGIASDYVLEQILSTLKGTGTTNLFSGARTSADDLGKGLTTAKATVAALTVAVKGLSTAIGISYKAIHSFDGGLGSLSSQMAPVTSEMGVFGTVLRQGVAELENNMKTYSLLSKLGAGTATEFDKLGILAAKVGMTQAQYANYFATSMDNLMGAGGSASFVKRTFDTLGQKIMDPAKGTIGTLTKMGLSGQQIPLVIDDLARTMGGLTNVVKAAGPDQEGLGEMAVKLTTQLQAMADITGKSTEMIANDIKMKQASAVNEYNLRKAQDNLGEGFNDVKLMLTKLGVPADELGNAIQFITTNQMAPGSKLNQIFAGQVDTLRQFAPVMNDLKMAGKDVGKRNAALDKGDRVMEGVFRNFDKIGQSMEGEGGYMFQGSRYGEGIARGRLNYLNLRDETGQLKRTTDAERRQKENVQVGPETPGATGLTTLDELTRRNIEINIDAAESRQKITQVASGLTKELIPVLHAAVRASEKVLGSEAFNGGAKLALSAIKSTIGDASNWAVDKMGYEDRNNTDRRNDIPAVHTNAVDHVRNRPFREGFRQNPYQSAEGGNPTVGIGHKLSDREMKAGGVFIGGKLVPLQLNNVQPQHISERGPKQLTVEQVKQLYDQDHKHTEEIVRQWIGPDVFDKLNPDQKLALSDLAFSGHGWKSENLRTAVRQGRTQDAAAIIRTWGRYYTTPSGQRIVTPNLDKAAQGRAELYSGTPYTNVSAPTPANQPAPAGTAYKTSETPTEKTTQPTVTENPPTPAPQVNTGPLPSEKYVIDKLDKMEQILSGHRQDMKNWFTRTPPPAR